MAGDNIHRSPNGERWVARWRNPQNQTRKKTFDTKQQAKAHIAQMSVDTAEGRYVDARKASVTFKEYAEDWRKDAPHRQSTADQVKSYLHRHAYPTLGDLRLDRITADVLQGWVNDLGGTLAPSTVEVISRHVRAVLNAAVEDRILKRSPWTRKKVKLPKVTSEDVRPIAPRDVYRIADAIQPRYRALVLFLLGTGCRSSEAYGLTMDRLDLEAGLVRIDRQLVRSSAGVSFGPPKTDASIRTIPMSDSTTTVLEHYIEQYGLGEHDLVFTNDKGEGIRRNRFGEVWREAIKGTDGVEARGPHQLRHVYASMLIRFGESLPTVSGRLGHSTITETARTYAHLWEDSDDRTRSAVNAGLAGLT